MKKILVFSVCLAALGMRPAAAATPSCYMTRMQDSSGATITLVSGFIYMVWPGQDRVNASLWRPLDRLQVCRGPGSASVITNLSLTKRQTITAIKETL